MILLDSSAWIAYFTGQPAAKAIDPYIASALVVPTIVLYEVYRRLTKSVGPQEAIIFIAQMEDKQVVPLNSELALQAAELSLQHNLATADAVVYATALTHQAKIITLDNDFRKLPGCEVLGSQ